MVLFLADLSSVNPTSLGSLSSLYGWTIGIIIFVLVIIGALYLYVSLAYSSIARKNKKTDPGIAWNPGVGPLFIAYRSSDMHWWPWLLIIGFFIPFVNIAAAIIFLIFVVIWHWKMFESVNKPGWWAIFMIIPLLNIISLVFIGIAAWSKQ